MSLILKVNIPKRGQKVTNGDVIKALFPNMEWWNAPYIGGIKSVDGLLDDIYNMADDSIVYGHLVNLVSGRKDIEETVNAITDAYRKIVLNVIKKYYEVGDTDGEDSN